MMRTTNTILSGSMALAIAQNASWEPSDADWYCPVDQSKAVKDFFLAQGYVVVPPDNTPTEMSNGIGQDHGHDSGNLHVSDDPVVEADEDDDDDDDDDDEQEEDDLEPYGNNHAIKSVLNLHHPALDVKMNLIVSVSQSPYAPVLFFHSTVVMNIVLADGLACFYPRLTFSMQGTVVWLLFTAPFIDKILKVCAISAHSVPKALG
jgi:hypothetical protein